jgi:hypothetical protein
METSTRTFKSGGYQLDDRPAFRVFTAQESADNHCNIGNTRLALDVIIQWIGGLKER